jgi:hypothetical protein
LQVQGAAHVIVVHALGREQSCGGVKGHEQSHHLFVFVLASWLALLMLATGLLSSLWHMRSTQRRSVQRQHRTLQMATSGMGAMADMGDVAEVKFQQLALANPRRHSLLGFSLHRCCLRPWWAVVDAAGAAAGPTHLLQ